MKSKDPTIESVFECSHANSTGCACKFVLRNDNTGELVGARREDTIYLNEYHSWRLYIAKTCLYNDILNEPFTSPQKLLDKLFTSPDFVIDQFTPPLSVLRNAISRLKSKVFSSSHLCSDIVDNLFHSAKTVDGDDLFLHKGTYSNRQHSTKQIFIFASRFQLDVARKAAESFWAMGHFSSFQQSSNRCTHSIR